MTRKQFLASILAAPAITSLRAAAPQVQVYKDPTCGCCGNWVQHLRTNGFQVSVQEVADTAAYRHKFGVPDALASCHTAVVENYALEGHVPATEVQRLLRERPKAKGLAVPGMPMGSPGMEAARTQPYNVMLIDPQGKSTIYASYPKK